MAEGIFVAYYRVSTQKQGLGLDAQRATVSKWLNGGNWSLIAEYEEKESGKDNDRVELRKAIEHCKKSGAKLVVAKLDRLSRNMAFIATLMDSGVEFVCCDSPHANKFTIHIFAALAEQEREFISKRTRDALATLKAKGARLGNPMNGTTEQTQKAAQGRSNKATEHALSIKGDIEYWQKQGFNTLKGLAEVLTRSKVPTSRGITQWDATQVKRVLERLNRAA